MATIIESPLKQEDEINSLREHFKDNIRILSSIGQFSYILKIRADQYDVSLTLQLDKSYPNKTPEIMITAPRLTPDQILLVQKLLQKYSEALLNQPMIFPIYSRLLKWFDENNIQTLDTTNNNNNNNNNNNTNHNHLNSSSVSPVPRSPTNSKCLPSFNQNKSFSIDEYDQTKRSSLKIIDEIFLLIETNSCLEKNLYRVGYFDQYHQIQEKSFDEFNQLNISKTQIQYFKYANSIIWDRESRTDFLPQTFIDLFKQNQTNTLCNEHSFFTNDLVTANYILSIPITDDTIISHYLKYREHFLSTNPNCISIDLENLHLTLLTFHLEATVQIEQCIIILKRIQEEIHYHCSYPERICLEFNQIEIYNNEYICLKCQSNQRLENLRQLIIERFIEQQEKQKITTQLLLDNKNDFQPHIILFKNKRKFTNILSNSIQFGKQTINALHLSSITNNENEQQINHCIFKLDLS